MQQGDFTQIKNRLKTNLCTSQILGDSPYWWKRNYLPPLYNKEVLFLKKLFMKETTRILKVKS